MQFDDILTINDTLKPKFWANEVLNSAVRAKLLKIASDFFNDLGLEGVDLEDVTFTGSLANFNWTKYSDVDLHLIIDFAQIDENYDLVREFFSAKTSNWNKNHNILIFGNEVELYVQDPGEGHYSSGVFSIKNNEWLVKPVREEPEVDVLMVKRKVKSFMDMIDRAEDMLDDKKYKESYDFSLKLVKKIKKFRQSGLEENGIYSNENLAFKYLRNNGSIGVLHDTRNSSYDKMMSIDGDFSKKFKIFVASDVETGEKGFNRLNELEAFQRNLKNRHERQKRRVIGHGGEQGGHAYPGNPSFERGKSAPPGAGGS